MQPHKAMSGYRIFQLGMLQVQNCFPALNKAKSLDDNHRVLCFLHHCMCSGMDCRFFFFFKYLLTLFTLSWWQVTKDNKFMIAFLFQVCSFTFSHNFILFAPCIWKQQCFALLSQNWLIFQNVMKDDTIVKTKPQWRSWLIGIFELAKREKRTGTQNGEH